MGRDWGWALVGVLAMVYGVGLMYFSPSTDPEQQQRRLVWVRAGAVVIGVAVVWVLFLR